MTCIVLVKSRLCEAVTVTSIISHYLAGKWKISLFK